MRMWSLHPKLLDAKGLVALWRETLLAKHVLQGKTKGYKNHPQLIRFRKAGNPIGVIAHYLEGVYEEALKRGYSFDKTKIPCSKFQSHIQVTRSQVEYEFNHLKKKLKLRDRKQFREIQRVKHIPIHPLFKKIPGPIESWEIL